MLNRCMDMEILKDISQPDKSYRCKTARGGGIQGHD